MNTYMDWMMMGYRVSQYAKVAGSRYDGEPLYSVEDVDLDDREAA